MPLTDYTPVLPEELAAATSRVPDAQTLPLLRGGKGVC
jgi:hypothetical protein